MNADLIKLTEENMSLLESYGYEVRISKAPGDAPNSSSSIDIKSNKYWVEITVWKNKQLYYCIYDEDLCDMVEEENLELENSENLSEIYRHILKILAVI